MGESFSLHVCVDFVDSSVLGALTMFMITITTYRFYVIRENKKLDAGGESRQHAMRHGITQEQIDLGWRYVGY